MPTVDAIIAKTVEYLSIPCVVGHEHFFMNYLRQDLERMGMKCFQHPQLLEVHGNDPHSAIICAHVDRHGLISIGGNEYVYAAQFIREIKYGENNQSSRKELQDIASRFSGEMVYAYDPENGKRLGHGIIETVDPDILNGDSLFYVYGMDEIAQNIPLAYSHAATVEHEQIKGQIDNAISAAVIHALFSEGFQGTVLLSTEEEIGKSWIHIADYLETEEIETKDVLVIDTSPYKEAAPLEEGMVILRHRDKSEVFNAALVEKLQARCSKINIPYQFKDEYLQAKGRTVDELGSTELGRLIQSRDKRWSGATIQIPTLMYHTSNETTSRQAIQNYYSFLKNILIDDPLDFKITSNREQPESS